MTSLCEAFPSLAKELSDALRADGKAALAEQVDGAIIERVTFDEAADAAYIRVQPSPQLGAIDVNIVGVRYGETIEVETGYWTFLDADNHHRLIGVEVLAVGGLKEDLKRYANA